jgi:hypothetical protein
MERGGERLGLAIPGPETRQTAFSALDLEENGPAIIVLSGHAAQIWKSLAECHAAT